MNPLLSVCVPAYNRPEYISDLIETILTQDFQDFELIVCEDNSPRTQEVEEVVKGYSERYPPRVVRFIRNIETLGYDGNFRKLIEVSHGKFCVFMGDDDLLCKGALLRIAEVIKNTDNLGVILRSWARADRETREVVEVFRYFDGDRLFEPGDDTVVTLYRRSVSIAGYTINRELAKKYSTDRFDGSLLYQLYLSGMVLSEAKGYYISDLLAIMRKDSNQTPTHFFGSAKAEKGRFQPGVLETQHSLGFVQGMIEIAQYLEWHPSRPGLYQRILRDMGNYSYPLLSYQYKQPIVIFTKYYFSLLKMGFWKNPYIHLYYFGLLLVGKQGCEKLIISIKKYFKRTPALGGLYLGKKVS